MTDTAALSADDVVTALLEAMDHDFWDDRLFSDAFDLEKLARVIDRLRASPAPDRVSDERLEQIAADRADWLVDAVATSTQNRAFLRGEPEEDEVATESIYLNGKKAILAALSEASK